MGSRPRSGELSDQLRRLLETSSPGDQPTDKQRRTLNALCVACADLSLGVPELPAPFPGDVLDDDVVELAPHVASLAPQEVPWFIVAAHEASLPAATRRARGAHATPREVGVGLCRVLLAGAVDPSDPPRVVDHSAGAGAFLLAAATVLAAEGVAPDVVVADLLFGCDVDAVSVSLARWALAAWCLSAGGGLVDVVPGHLRVADGLDPAAFAGTGGRFDVIVGNPPFLAQLSSTTARSAAERRALAERSGGAVRGYADTAAAFLAHSVERLRDGGRLVMIVPESLFSTRDAGPVRRRVLETCAVTAVWSGGRAAFDASVGTCAILARRGGARGPVTLLVGPGVDEVGALDSSVLDDDTWGAVLAGLRGVPSVSLRSSAIAVGDVATVAAGFRDQFYGLVDSVREADDVGVHDPDARWSHERRWARLVTVGMIDPFALRWGRAEFRFARRRWRRPLVDLEDLAARDPDLHRWYDAILAPKVCVATQTKVVEVAVDVDGSWAATTPVVSVVADGVDVWHLAAALGSPAVAAWSFTRAGGSGLSGDAVRLSASLVRSVPLPSDSDAWDVGAAVLAAGRTAGSTWDQTTFVEAMAQAYGCDSAVGEWWVGRLPVRASDS